MSDGVTGGAVAREKITSVFLNNGGIGVTEQWSSLAVLKRREPVSDHDEHKTRIIRGGVQHPLVCGLVTDEHSGLMAVTVIRIGFGIEAEFFPDQLYIRCFPGIERPSRPNVIIFGILLEHFRRVTFGIDGDGIEENIFAHLVAQHLQHLCKARGLQRAGIHAMRVDHIDDYTFAFDQVIVEVNGFSILVNERDIGEIVGTPADSIGFCRANVEQGRSENQQRPCACDLRPTDPSHCNFSLEFPK